METLLSRTNRFILCGEKEKLSDIEEFQNSLEVIGRAPALFKIIDMDPLTREQLMTFLYSINFFNGRRPHILDAFWGDGNISFSCIP